jgi:type II secretory pathway pseudopilin PulG
MRIADMNGNIRQGSALIAIIAAILLFSVLAAVLLPMVSSSGRQAALSHLADQAYLLAESGYRLVESRYRNAVSDLDKYVALEALNGQTFQPGGNVGQFDIRIFSYFYVLSNGAAAGENAFTAKPPGSFPEDVSIASGQKLRIGAHLYTVNSHSPGDNGEVVFDIAEPIAESVPAGTGAYPVVAADRLAFEEATNLLSLYYTSGRGGMFPLKNGAIHVAGRRLTYRHRADDRFVDVRDPLDPFMGQAILSGELIALPDYARVHSTGMAGGGDFPVRREVIYYGALPSSATFDLRDAFADTFDQDAPGRWQAVDDDSAAVIDVGAGALRVVPSAERAALVRLDPAVTEARFKRHRTASDGYLSYDLQVKVGYDGDIFEPPSITAAGLSFRLSSVESSTVFNGYGLSFLWTGPAGGDTAGENLLRTIAPPVGDGRLLIVLWQRTSAGAAWLAYKSIPEIDVPRQFATLLAELQEAAVLEFSGGGTQAFQRGDRVFGQSSGAMGTVISPPLIRAGEWGEGDAAGVLLLNRLSSPGNFTQGETLVAMGGDRAAVAGALTERANIITCYFAADGEYPRLGPGESLQWPSGDDDSRALFHRVEWEGVNNALVEVVPTRENPSTILRSAHPDLASGPAAVPELGLHAFGEGAANVFFDDFGFRLVFPLRDPLATPLQQ